MKKSFILLLCVFLVPMLLCGYAAPANAQEEAAVLSLDSFSTLSNGVRVANFTYHTFVCAFPPPTDIRYVKYDGSELNMIVTWTSYGLTECRGYSEMFYNEMYLDRMCVAYPENMNISSGIWPTGQCWFNPLRYRWKKYLPFGAI